MIGRVQFGQAEAQRRFDLERQLQRDKEKREDEARLVAFERESAVLAAEAARRQEAEAKAAQEKKRLEAPRQHALEIRNTEGAPVYYFDTSNVMQELGKEIEKAPRDNAVPMKRVKRLVERRVYGPDAKRQLVEGEWELVTKVVWVSVPAW